MIPVIQREDNEVHYMVVEGIKECRNFNFQIKDIDDIKKYTNISSYFKDIWKNLKENNFALTTTNKYELGDIEWTIVDFDDCLEGNPQTKYDKRD